MENQNQQNKLRELYQELSELDKNIYSASKQGEFEVVRLLIEEKARISNLIKEGESLRPSLKEKSKSNYSKLTDWFSLWRDLVSKPKLMQQPEKVVDQQVANAEAYLREYSSLLFGKYTTISQVDKPSYQSKVDKAAVIVKGDRKRKR